MQDTIPHLHRLPLNDVAIDGVQNMALNPVGPTVYVHVHQSFLDPLALAMAYWHWVLSAAALVVFAFVMWRWVVISTRRQRPGALHCRRCNYELSGHAVGEGAGACPECGARLDRARAAVVGRSTRRRVMPLVIPAALLVGILGLGIAMALGWQPRVARWPSPRAQRIADALGYAPVKAVVADCSTIYEVDLATGKILRTVVAQGPVFFHEFGVDPTGQRMVVGGERYFSLRCVSVRDGSTIAEFDYSAGTQNSPAMAHIQQPLCGFVPDGSGAYIMANTGANTATQLVRWSFADGSTRPLADFPTYAGTRGGSWVRGAAVIPGSGERVLSWPHFMEAYPTKRYVLMLHAGPGDPLRTADLGESVNASSYVAMAPDGSRAYFVGGAMRELGAVEMSDLGVGGGGPGFVQLPGTITGHSVEVDATGRLVAVGGFGGIAVRDTLERKWAAVLALPSDLYGAHAAFSPGGGYVVAEAQWGSSGAFRHELLIWDISKVREGLEAPAPAEQSK